MNIRPGQSVEMNSIHRARTSSDRPNSVNAHRSHDVFEHTEAHIGASSLSSTVLVGPGVNEQVSQSRQQAVQNCNQKGWGGFILRFLPLIALGVTATGLAYSYLNHRAITAQKTLRLVRGLQPALLNAHEKILAALHSLQEKMGINSTSTDAITPFMPDLDRR